MEKQNNKYFTIWYGVYRRPGRELAYGNAGHPAALLFTGPTAGAARLCRLESQGPAVGVFPEYDFETGACKLDGYARLLVYSDGVYEIEKADGAMWKFAEFVDYVAGLPPEGGSAMDRVLDHVRGLHGSGGLADDFSMLEVRF
jgi:sigma-B regulation protein RsbU (phosphoserine phosphatase)